MKILVHGLNYAPEQVGIAVYTTSMAGDLVRAGHEVRVVAGRPYYPGWAIMDGRGWFSGYRTEEHGVFLTRVPHFVPRRPSGTKRLLHHASFALSSFLPLVWQTLTWRPDVVIGIAPALVGAPAARAAAWLTGAHAWLHVQDFEVEAAVATGLVRGGGPLVALARRVEASIFSGFDTVSTISEPMCRRLVEKGVPAENVVEFRNGAELDTVRPLPNVSRFRAEWGIETDFVALYAGTVGSKQGIEIIADAARLLAGRHDLTFVVCGEGAGMPALRAAAAGLPNLRLFGLQSRDRLGELLGLADVHLLPQRAEAADLVLPSKLGNMLASGRPVVATAAAGTGIAEEIADCGIATPPGDAEAFAGAIARLLDDPERRLSLGLAARSRAEHRWSRRAVAQEFEQNLLTRVMANKAVGRPEVVEAGRA